MYDITESLMYSMYVSIILLEFTSAALGAALPLKVFVRHQGTSKASFFDKGVLCHDRP
jgi:hypothetical protein